MAPFLFATGSIPADFGPEARKSGAIPSKKKETYEALQKLLSWNVKYNENTLPNFISDCKYQDKIVTIDDNDDIFKYLHGIR